jgi:hypothetical protein
MIATRRWRPSYPSVDTFLRAAATTDDPLFIRYISSHSHADRNLGLTFSHSRVPYLSDILALASKLSDWKEQRLSPPRVNQSAVGLSSSSGTDTQVTLV